jgi:hypothetical protein
MDSRSFLSRILGDAEVSRDQPSGLSSEDEKEIMRAFGVDPGEIEKRRAQSEGAGTGDATLDEAMRHFEGRLNPEELDMGKWIGGEEK